MSGEFAKEPIAPEVSKREKDLISLTEKQILEMDNSVKVHWARELGLYYGKTDTAERMRAVEYELLKARREALAKLSVPESGKSNPGSSHVLIDCSCAAFGPLEVEFTLEEAKSIGDSIGVNWDKIDEEQFRQGLAVEMEHGCRTPETNLTCDKPDLTGKIALSHLHEDSVYYSKLKKAGL